MGKTTTSDAEPSGARASAPKKAKGLTKKRGRKDRFAAEANTQKRAARRAETTQRRTAKHYDHVMAWADRNGAKLAPLSSVAAARSAVRERRLFPKGRG